MVYEPGVSMHTSTGRERERERERGRREREREREGEEREKERERKREKEIDRWREREMERERERGGGGLIRTPLHFREYEWLFVWDACRMCQIASGIEHLRLKQTGRQYASHTRIRPPFSATLNEEIKQS